MSAHSQSKSEYLNGKGRGRMKRERGRERRCGSQGQANEEALVTPARSFPSSSSPPPALSLSSAPSPLSLPLRQARATAPRVPRRGQGKAEAGAGARGAKCGLQWERHRHRHLAADVARLGHTDCVLCKTCRWHLVASAAAARPAAADGRPHLAPPLCLLCLCVSTRGPARPATVISHWPASDPPPSLTFRLPTLGCR